MMTSGPPQASGSSKNVRWSLTAMSWSPFREDA